MIDQPSNEPPEPMLQFFEYQHLKPELQDVSAPFSKLAHQMASQLPRNPERSAGLRKLMEAKDCFVRAKLYKVVDPGRPVPAHGSGP
jgi:hypothetical protein